MVQKATDERCIQVLWDQLHGRLVEPFLSKSKEQPKRVTITSDRMAAGTHFREQALREIAVKQSGQSSVDLHDKCPPLLRSQRRVACRSNSGTADRYQ